MGRIVELDAAYRMPLALTMFTLLTALLLAQQPIPVTPACAATDTALPSGLAGWTSPGASLASGSATRVSAGATLPNLPPAHRTGPGAAVRFTIVQASTYAIALDQAAWLDVLPLDPAGNVGAALRSVGHGHGPACSTIRKIVRFDLAPGTYALQLSGLQRPEARVMLVPADALPQEPRP